MRMNKINCFAALITILIIGCTKTSGIKTSGDIFTGGESYVPGTSNSGGGDSGVASQPGVITAGEWNDLEHWDFWNNILLDSSYSKMPGYWGFYHAHRIAVNISGTNGLPVTDALVQLKANGTTLCTAKTDNKGNCELWPDLFKSTADVNFSGLQLCINNGNKIVNGIKPYEQGINKIILPDANTASNKIEISFVVDATGSMGDELEYLKTELYDVISRIKNDNPAAALSTASVFYRDAGDAYLTKASDFTNDIAGTINFIKDQNADGGGDFPEAVHAALDKAVNDLQWSASAKTRILFLILDAPPHYEPAILQSLHNSISAADEKGIKIIPVTASGIDKETEFLMRFMAISTNGTYVFITNDSGIGNDHLIPTVGDYDVEFLNNLMVRLVDKYAQ